VTLASRFYGDPAKSLFMVGVTGTNGKTSTTYMVECILNHFGMKTGVMGTINHHIGDTVWESELTTPDPITLQRRLREFRALNAKAVAFEVSSHAIDQGRTAGLPFNCLIFTNLTRDHLDYHHTMENYFATKERLFREVPLSIIDRQVHAMINVNDEWGQKIQASPNVLVWTFGESQSDFQFQILETQYAGTRFRLNTPRGQAEFFLPVPGRHNVYNAVGAIGAALAAGASLEICVEALRTFSGVPGRLERVKSKKEFHVFIDYAHTDDALRTVLAILKQIREQSHQKNKIITVFGCGGDRDKGKRPLMARAAVEGSDIVIVTSDNPRTEEPMLIIQDILAGVPKELLNSKVFVEVDRREAIRKALELASPKDVVLVAGKGHEPYQIIGNRKYDFHDAAVAGEFLNGV
jgi:UDP-N-acetylmuramoyl-L-alanyl-D-glutamate--2,6-diaminopimelate ligase